VVVYPCAVACCVGEKGQQEQEQCQVWQCQNWWVHQQSKAKLINPPEESRTDAAKVDAERLEE